LNIIEKGKRYANIYSQIQIIGNSEVIIEGCKKILEYNDIFVKVKALGMIVNIWGSELSVNDFGHGSVFVNGSIQSVELEKNG